MSIFTFWVPPAGKKFSTTNSTTSKEAWFRPDVSDNLFISSGLVLLLSLSLLLVGWDESLVPDWTAHDKACGVSRVTGSSFLRDVAVEFFQTYVFFSSSSILERRQTSLQPISQKLANSHQKNLDGQIALQKKEKQIFCMTRLSILSIPILPHPGPLRSSRASIHGPERPRWGPWCPGCKMKGPAAEADWPAASPDGPSPTCQTRHSKETERTHAARHQTLTPTPAITFKNSYSRIHLIIFSFSKQQSGWFHSC